MDNEVDYVLRAKVATLALIGLICFWGSAMAVAYFII